MTVFSGVGAGGVGVGVAVAVGVRVAVGGGGDGATSEGRLKVQLRLSKSSKVSQASLIRQKCVFSKQMWNIVTLRIGVRTSVRDLEFGRLKSALQLYLSENSLLIQDPEFTVVNENSERHLE